MKVTFWLVCSLKFFGILLLMTSLSLSGTNAIKLDCSYESGWFSEIGEEKSFHCDARNFEVTKPNEEIDGVITSYENGNDAVKGIYIYGQTLNYFPAGIEKEFKNLNSISVYDSKLKRITQANLKPFTELKELRIVGNEINILEKDLFKFNTKLICMIFQNNKMQHIDSRVLDPLTQLKTVYFHENPCIDIYATTPTEMQKLRNEIERNICQNQKVAKKHEMDAFLVRLNMTESELADFLSGHLEFC